MCVGIPLGFLSHLPRFVEISHGRYVLALQISLSRALALIALALIAFWILAYVPSRTCQIIDSAGRSSLYSRCIVMRSRYRSSVT